MDLHGVGAAIEEHDLFTVHVREEADLEIILLLLHIDGHLDAFSSEDGLHKMNTS